jgi:hypothetical protein
MSRLIMAISSLAFRIFPPHGLQTRSDSYEVELTSIPILTEHNSTYFGQGFAIVVIVSFAIKYIFSVAPYFSFKAHLIHKRQWSFTLLSLFRGPD